MEQRRGEARTLVPASRVHAAIGEFKKKKNNTHTEGEARTLQQLSAVLGCESGRINISTTEGGRDSGSFHAELRFSFM